jgi:hypothetical protein
MIPPRGILPRAMQNILHFHERGGKVAGKSLCVNQTGFAGQLPQVGPVVVESFWLLA